MSGRHLTPGELAFVRQGIRLYEALVADLRALEANGWPAPEDLLDAPLLDTWKPRLKPVKCLQGNVHGHPSIADGDMETAPIVAMPGGNRQDVVRTQSRWYRLGKPRASQ